LPEIACGGSAVIWLIDGESLYLFSLERNEKLFTSLKLILF
jgi:hypothetical protein